MKDQDRDETESESESLEVESSIQKVKNSKCSSVSCLSLKQSNNSDDINPALHDQS